ncbi:MAG TPA: TonB-dependent receptor [Prolixibacteraceae bacterium]|nr:TonB-dependent receptor [Prolixibacteraceae bacterium]
MVLSSSTVFAQKKVAVKGLVTDEKNDPITGAIVVLKGNTTTGTVTDINGEFSLNIPEGNQFLVISFVGMESQEVEVSSTKKINVTLKEKSTLLSETVIIGYGQQKKESVVGAITQAKGEVLEKTGGVSSVGMALTGNLPGVVTVSTKGTPGDEDPKIYIRGQSTWNTSDPLILVDGIERKMSSVDISSIENISVLKDASATAVFGVKGANGVILITTKRGKDGKADIRVSLNSTVKVPSLLATKYDSYDALRVRNEAIEREVSLNEAAWEEYTPLAELNKYRNPSNQEEAERYPNVDWANELVKKFAMSYNANVSASGGTSFVKYFSSMDYLYEGDILKKIDNGKSYDPGYGYRRINVRSNLDFNLTKTTILTANLAGSYGVKQDAWNQDSWEYRIWQSIYSNPPDAYLARYPDGSWGYYEDHEVDAVNSLLTIGNNGIRKITTTQINTDFTLKQDLSMILKGLNAKGTLSFDNTFKSVGGIYDNGSVQQKYINPVTGEVTYSNYLGTNKFDFIPGRWSTRSDATYTNMWGGSENYRKLYYQLQLDYAKKFGKHDVTAMGLFSRDKYATGSEFEHFREDWVFRATYNYASKYFAEFNGAYNGSEKFSSENRFAFFPSGALGWMLTEEKFMKNIRFLDMLKIRGSYGQVGDDNVSERWLYMTQWKNENVAPLGAKSGDNSPYTWWYEDKIGNEDIHWEKVTKTNLGADFSILKGLVAGSIDVFNDYRTDILLAGADRSVPSYFGGTPATGNMGKVRVKGYEFELRFNKTLNKDMRLWGNFSMAHSKDKVIEADDPYLKDDYLKKEGKQIDQTRSYVGSGYYNTWDEVYSSTKLDSYDKEKLPGNLNMIDYNGDGVINTYDQVPYGYPERPQNTYNATIGFEWKGFSAYVQFYGVNNCNRYVSLASFSGHMDRVYNLGTFWTPENTDADAPMPRWNTHMDYSGTTYLYDGSYLRLKNVEIAYTFKESKLQRMGVNALRIFVNGNNLWMWTNMPDDREVNMGSSSAYPTVKRINLGLNITF